MLEYGVYIKNIEAGSLYEVNHGARESFRYTSAMMANSLFLDFLLANGLKIWKETMTRDIIGLDFQMGSCSFDEEIKRLTGARDKYVSLGKEDAVNKIDELIAYASSHPENYIKKSKEDIRTEFYRDGVNVTYITRKANGEIKKSETIHYKMLFRSTGKAKKGSCIFIRDKLYNRAIDFLRMGIKVPKHNAPIVELSAYAPLVSSAVVGKVIIHPENILVVKDIVSYFRTNVVSVETDENRHCVAKRIDDYELKNTMFDGQALIDSSIFPKWGNGYILLRHHFCKMAAFNTNIQEFYRNYFGSEYNNAIVTDIWGNKHYAKDIELITTENAMKWMKFKVPYTTWCKKVRENGCQFGIVKTAHKSKLGEVQRMSYQMVNALDMDIMPDVAARSVEYINQLKTDDSIFLDYLKKNINFANDYDVLVDLVESVPDFIRSEYFRKRRERIIRSYVLNFKSGHINQNGDNLVIVGSPYAMLLTTVGESVDKDTTFSTEEGTIQCYTRRFSNGAYLAEFRSPFNSKNNLGYLHNVYSYPMEIYFNLGEQVVAINMRNTDFQDRNNGSDQDSDSIYVTDQQDIVKYAQYCYLNYPTIVNNIRKESKSYDNDLELYAQMDNDLASAQRAIGESSNLAQIALTYSYNFPDQKYQDYVCILSVIAQVAIDSAKRRFDLDLVEEIRYIKKDMDVKENKYPSFWASIKKDFNKNNLNHSLKCPMNYLNHIKFKNIPSTRDTLPMEYFYQSFPLDENRRKCKKVEDLIAKYGFDLYESAIEQDDVDYWMLNDSFEQLIHDIRSLYFSKSYKGLMSWLIGRAFNLGSHAQPKLQTQALLEANKVTLMKVLYRINPKVFIEIFSKNA